VVSPSADFFADMAQGPEPMQVQVFIPELAVADLDKGVLDRLARLDEP